VPLPAPPVHHVAIAQVQAVLGAIASCLTILVAIGASALLLPKAVLATRLRSAEGRARVAEGALGAVSMALDALRGEVEAMNAKVSELQTLPAKVADLQRALDGTKLTLVATMKYTVDLIVYSRRRGSAATMPEPPPEISDAVLAELRARDASVEVAVGA
jgi:hypothetical protein